MDLLGWVFSVTFFVSIAYPNIDFFRKLKFIKNIKLKYKLIHVLISIIIPCLVIVLYTAVAMYSSLSKFDNGGYIYRIIFAGLVFPSCILGNIFFSKFYFKKISKLQNNNEIQLIGKE